MVMSGPRSASTWCANWLTTDTSLCLHDPLLQYTSEYLARMNLAPKRLGISCTSALLYPDWVKTIQCPKVILYRDPAEINTSLRRLGLAELIVEGRKGHLSRIEALMEDKGTLLLPYEYMLYPKGAKRMAGHLGVPWDADRHDLLCQMRIEPMWKRLHVSKEAAQELVQRIKESLES